jgi:ATP-dependent DNA helicase DinG
MAYQDMIVRLRLRQAFGRLIRGGSDRGVFVVLDARLASRFLTAFPENTPFSRCGLVEAIDRVSDFLGLAQGAERP